MVSNVTSGGGIAQLARQLPQIQSGNDNQQKNQFDQVQKDHATQQQHASKAPAPTVNTQGQRTGSVINTTA